MSTDNTDILNQRIKERVLLGDHFVTPSVVEQRYINGLKLLNHYFSYPDRLQLIDNSSKVQLIADFRKGEIIHVAQKLAEWVTKHFGEHLQQKPNQDINVKDMKNIDEVKKAYRKLRHKP